MRTDHVLTLTHWLSPAFPVGAFAYSHGLEWAIEAGQVTDRDTLATWIDTTLRHGAGRTDALFLAAGFHASDPQPVDQLARAYAASAERLKETVLQGEAFCRAIADLSGRPMAMLTYPVAVGHAAQQHALPLQLTAQMFLQAFVVNLAGVAMRLVPLGQTEGQRVICDLMPTCSDVADDAMDSTLDDLASTAFLSDIASMKHETQYSRIFRT